MGKLIFGGSSKNKKKQIKECSKKKIRVSTLCLFLKLKSKSSVQFFFIFRSESRQNIQEEWMKKKKDNYN